MIPPRGMNDILPGDAAADEIAASNDPAVAAVRICRETPMRGTWRY